MSEWREARGSQRWWGVLSAVALVGIMMVPLSPATAAPATVDRIEGPDRYAVAIRIAQEAYPATAPVVFLAHGADFPDALSGAPAAIAEGGPLLLTPSAALPDSVLAEIERLAPSRVVVLGGPASVSASVVDRIVDRGFAVDRIDGADRYAVSRSIAQQFFADSTTAFLASGRGFADALSGAGAAGGVGAPVILVDGLAGSLDASTRAVLTEMGVTSIVILGGPATVSTGIENDAASFGTVERLGGADRYAVSVAVNARFYDDATRAFFAAGLGFPDALAGAAYAGAARAPLYLVPPGCPTAAAITDVTQRLAVERVTILGGPASVSPQAELLEACGGTPTTREQSEAALTQRLTSLAAALPGDYSVTVHQLGGLEATVRVRGALMQEPASVMKLFAVYAILDRIDRGVLTLQTATRSGVSVETCMRVVIHISDNDCHWDLVALIGNQALNDQFWSEGFTQTVYAGRRGDGAVYSSKHTTTDDVALLLRRLEAGELLSEASTDRFIGLLETQVWRHRVPSGVPAGVPVANKTGQLWVASGMIEADAAIVTAPSGTYVVTIMGSRNATGTGVRDLGRAVYEHFEGPFGTAVSYPNANSFTLRSLAYSRSPGGSIAGYIPAGTALRADAGSRAWYRVFYGGSTFYVDSSGLTNYYGYPRR